MVHERNASGLLLAEAAELDAEIHRQFDLGTDTLFVQDHHLLQQRSHEEVLALLANAKRLWVAAIRLGRELYFNNHDDEHKNMRQFMQAWQLHT